MNNKRRKKLQEASNYLDRASSLITMSLDEEEDYMNNMPENLQNGDKYERADAAVEYLYDASEKLDDIIDSVQSAISM